MSYLAAPSSRRRRRPRHHPRGPARAPMATQGTWLSPSQVPKSELESDQQLLARRPRFSLRGLGRGIPEPADGAQGTWLSPKQVPKWERESDKALLAKESFTLEGMGKKKSTRRRRRRRPPMVTQGTWLSPSQVPQSERESVRQLLARRPRFSLRGLGRGIPEPTDGAQGTWLSPKQVPKWERESARQMLSKRQQFGGLGQAPMSPQRAAQLYALRQQAAALAAQYARPSIAKGSPYAGGARLFVDPTKQIETAFVEGQVQLQPICDPETGACISYATPAEVEEAIARKVEGRTAVGTGQVQLPGFYAHPTLGPWGVDPQQAWQYWAAQQAAAEAAPFMSPLSVFGSPGVAAKPVPPLGPSSVAQPAAYDPYQQAFPTAGAAVERF